MNVCVRQSGPWEDMTYPEDIVRVANELLDQILQLNEAEHQLQEIMSTILAERQRCADVARSYLEDIAGCDMGDDEPDMIAAAVMDPKWEPPPL